MDPTGAGATNLVGMITSVNLRCRMVDLKKVKDSVSDDANTKFAYMLEKALAGSPHFIAEATRFGQLEPSGDQLTYVFQITLTLRRPIRL